MTKQQAVELVKSKNLAVEVEAKVIDSVQNIPDVDNLPEDGVIQLIDAFIQSASGTGENLDPSKSAVVGTAAKKKSTAGKVLKDDDLKKYYDSLSQEDKKAVEDQLLADGVTFEQRMENTNNTKVEKFIMSNLELKDRLTDPKQTEAALTKEDKEKYNKKKYLWEEYLYDNSAENLAARDAFVALLNEEGKTAKIKFAEKYSMPSGVRLRFPGEDKAALYPNKVLGDVLLAKTNAMIIDEANNFIIATKVRAFEDVNSTTTKTKTLPSYQGIINLLDKENGKGADLIEYTKEVSSTQKEFMTVPLDIKITVKGLEKKTVDGKRVISLDKNNNPKKRVFRPRATVEGWKVEMKDEFKEAGFSAGIGQAQVRKSLQEGTPEYEKAKENLIALWAKTNAAKEAAAVSVTDAPVGIAVEQ